MEENSTRPAVKIRDEFSEKTKAQIAKQVGYLCSFPNCRVFTVGATQDGRSIINIGTAAHICAAAPGGPRYDDRMSATERSAPENGIWMCRDHGKAIDSDEKAFPAKLLREWKQQAHTEAWERVLRVEGKVAAFPSTEIGRSLRSAAEDDLNAFRATAKWPKTAISLMLKVSGLDEPIPARTLAKSGVALQDLILTAPPGMGKTTTLFQLAEGILEGGGVPLFISLGDWATDSAGLLESILRRGAFQGISEQELRRAAGEAGMVLLLDGWNELDLGASRRARVQIETLKAELPNLGLMISTRRQAIDVPFRGAQADLLPLDETLQLEIAVALRDQDGAALLDQAWRTPGVRELVSVPLYLEALMSLPNGAVFPTTKEAVLSHFVAAHEMQHQHADALRLVTGGLQAPYLEDLAAQATQTANTAVSDSDARRSIARTVLHLSDDGQITIKPQPDAVLGVLVSDHLLTRSGTAPGYTFQHQQFQEWYASHEVERRMIDAGGDAATRDALKAEILNLPAWEEAIFFAVERLARGDAVQCAACGEAIRAAFEVDPILSAEMTFRGGDAVWALVGQDLGEKVRRWHASGEVDRALRFMLTSGRPEFLDLVWPIITNDNQQVSLRALRQTTIIRPSVLGLEPESRIKALKSDARGVLLHELASHSGMDGMDLASKIAREDPDVEVQVTVVEALAFRRADRHVADILDRAGPEALQHIADSRVVDLVDDAAVRATIASIRAATPQTSQTTEKRLLTLLQADDDSGGADLTELVATLDLDTLTDPTRSLLGASRNRHSQSVASGVIERVKTGLPLFYGAVDVVIAAGFSVEDDDLVGLAQATPGDWDDAASAAAAVLGPVSVGELLDALLAIAPLIRTDQAAATYFRRLGDRLTAAPESSLLAAVDARSAAFDCEQIARVADQLTHRRGERDPRGQAFTPEGAAQVQSLIEDWGQRLLEGGASRWQLQTLAVLMQRAPTPDQISLLRRLLDRELKALADARSRATASNWRNRAAISDLQTSNISIYEAALRAIGGVSAREAAEAYLLDETFGGSAARVISALWERANLTPSSHRFGFRPDFSGVADRRAQYLLNPAASCDEAETLFAAIDSQIAPGASAESGKLAVQLAMSALRLPHGQRPETVARLVALSDYRARLGLLQSLVASGTPIDIDLVAVGIAKTLEAAKTDTWILTDSNGYLFREWLQLLAFTAQPDRILDVIADLPAPQRDPRFFENLIRSLAELPTPANEAVLFAIAQQEPKLYAGRVWQEAVFNFGTASSMRRYFDIVVEQGEHGKATDDLLTVRRLAAAVAADPELRTHVYDCLRNHPDKPGMVMAAGVVAESPDEDGLILLVERQINNRRTTMGWRTIEQMVTDQIPVDGWQGSYEVVPRPAHSLRRRLLAMASDGGRTDVAARWLEEIDKIRDEHGRPELEPRHPDLESGKAWPIILDGVTVS